MQSKLHTPNLSQAHTWTTSFLNCFDFFLSEWKNCSRRTFLRFFHDECVPGPHSWTSLSLSLAIKALHCVYAFGCKVLLPGFYSFLKLLANADVKHHVSTHTSVSKHTYTPLRHGWGVGLVNSEKCEDHSLVLSSSLVSWGTCETQLKSLHLYNLYNLNVCGAVRVNYSTMVVWWSRVIATIQASPALWWI